MSNLYKIGLAGCGKMGASMVCGWRSAGLIDTIDILDPNEIPADILGAGFKHYTDKFFFMEQASTWDILVLAIKPQDIEKFFLGKKLVPSSVTVLSIVAGHSLASFERHLGNDHPVIRCMPNLPASIGKGITVACPNGNTGKHGKETAQALLSSMGVLEWTNDESIMDAVTAVSGSGPAYVFYLIEALAEAGVKAGLDPELSMSLARQTIIGSAALAEDDADTSAATLRENVTSPNGTTAAALSVLMDGRLQGLMNDAIARATARSKELSK